MKTLNPVRCLSCPSIGVYAKGLCKSCYHKHYRQTPEGKASTKRYNDSPKAVEAKKPEHLQKTIQKDMKCECGNTCRTMGLCKSCYLKNYYIKKGTYSGKPRKAKTNFSESDFNSILSLVNSGLTVENACKKRGISRNKLYKNIDAEQKSELKISKLLSRKTPVSISFK